MAALTAGIIVVVAAGILLTDKGRTLAKGFLNLFFEDVAKTTKGADAIFAQAIEEEQEKYNKASNVYNTISGKLQKAKEKLEIAKQDLAQVEQACEKFVARGDMENAALYADKRDEILIDKDFYEKEIVKLAPMEKEAKFIFETVEKNLKKLKKERTLVIKKMELNQQSEEVYNNLDELKNTKGTSKLLETIKNEVESGDERVAGARTVYNNKTSTRMAKAEVEMRRTQRNDYLEELKKKHGK